MKRIYSMMIAPCIFGLLNCSPPNQFVDVEVNKPHAILTADKAERWRDSGPTVFHLNSQPTKFWRFSENYRIPIGITDLSVVGYKEPYQFKPFQFNAIENRHYHLRYTENRSSVSLYDITINSKPKLIIKSPRLKK